jgi:predicted nucleic acid-binding protein
VARALLIDTSAWVEAMRRRGDEATRIEVYAALRTGRARYCDMVRLELWNGIGGEPERRWLTKVEQDIEIVPTDDRVWAEARILAQETRRKGISLPATERPEIQFLPGKLGFQILHHDSKVANRCSRLDEGPDGIQEIQSQLVAGNQEPGAVQASSFCRKLIDQVPELHVSPNASYIEII